MNKKIKYLFLLILSIFINSNLVNANINDHIIDFNKKGSISITVKETTTPIKDTEITIYQVATATSINNTLAFVYDENIKDCKGDLSDLENESLVTEIDKCISNTILPKQTKLTNEEGLVKFDNLELGLYLIKQTNKVEGYSTISPFLVTIPKEENNKWIYDINSSPKTDIIKLIDISVEKKWDNIINDIPKEVTIELLKDNKVLDTVTLNNENNWTYTWNEIEKSDEYSVKEINIPDGYTATYRQEENKFIVTNTKALVQTGQNIFIIELLTITGLIFIVIGFLLNKRNKHE